MMAARITKKGPAKQVTAVSRATLILRHLGRSYEPLGVNRIARDLGLIPSTALHILRTLVHEDLVAFDPNTKRYGLGIGILGIAQNMLSRSGFAQAAHSHLEAIAAAYDVAAVGVELDNREHMVVVALARSQLDLSIHVNIGSHFPALISATGRCVAARSNWNNLELERRFKKLHWQRPPEFKTWIAEIETARLHGYAIDDGNYIAGVVVIAALVEQIAGSPTRAVVAVGLSEQLNCEQRRELAQRLRATADNLTNLK